MKKRKGSTSKRLKCKDMMVCDEVMDEIAKSIICILDNEQRHKSWIDLAGDSFKTKPSKYTFIVG